MVVSKAHGKQTVMTQVSNTQLQLHLLRQMVNGKLMVPMVPGLPRTKVADGLVKMVPQRADGMLTTTLDSLEPGGVMITTKEEPGPLKMQLLISKQPRSQSILKLVPGSVQMVLQRVLGKLIP